MSISKRLKTIAEMVTAGNTAADIGTDHGYVPIYLLQNDICPRVIACDVSKGPLERAKENSLKYELQDRMECRLADGLAALEPGEADTIIISGMGGILMTDILKAKESVVMSAKELILSPHRDLELVKEYVINAGFVITEELEMTDKKKKYIIIKAAR